MSAGRDRGRKRRPGIIRIIGGLYKGKRLKRVPSPDVRPMQHKLRGALFNMLRDGLEGAVFLDGFSGTGAVGLEALSRGASTAVFIESFYPAVKAIRENAAACGAGDRALVMHRDFNRAVIELAGKGLKFDIIVLDPPYLMLKDRNPLKVIRKRALLKPGGLIILRHFDKIEPPRNDFYLVRQVHVGDDILSFFRWPEDEPESQKTGARGDLKKTRPSVKIGRTKS